MPYYSFFLAQDVRAYSSTRAIEAPNRAAASRRLQQMLEDGELDNMELNAEWDSASARDIELDDECDHDDYNVVDAGPGTPEPDTMSMQLLLRPAVEVVSGLALLSQREKEINDER